MVEQQMCIIAVNNYLSTIQFDPESKRLDKCL